MKRGMRASGMGLTTVKPMGTASTAPEATSAGATAAPQRVEPQLTACPQPAPEAPLGPTSAAPTGA